MIPLKVTVQSLRPPGVMATFFNGWVREGLILAGLWWIENRLKEHFGPRATATYFYAMRTAGHLLAKARKFADMRNLAQQIRQHIKKKKFAGPVDLLRDPHPFEFTGRAKSGATSGAKARASATSNSVKLEITVPIGFCGIHAKHRDVISGRSMITKILKWENDTMRRIVIDHVNKRRAEFRQMVQHRIAG